MVDRDARDRYADLLRRFVGGELTNDEYEFAAEVIFGDAHRDDPALRKIWFRAWFLYDDIRVHRLCDRHALTPEGQRAVGLWILFLESGLEYEWPVRDGLGLAGCLVNLCTLGLAGLVVRPLNERLLRGIGALDLWPFFREEDYQSAVARAGGATRPVVGICVKCGYDLRATPLRCPECGTVPGTVPARDGMA